VQGVTTGHFNILNGSHLPILMKIVNMTDGPILELGTGFYSTPYLHWACYDKKRKLVSYDTHLLFFDIAKGCVADFHEVHFVENGDWDNIDLSGHWSIVLVDHAPGKRRKEEIRRLANSADYIVVHDTNGRFNPRYKYTEIYPLFKYRYDYTKIFPFTTVLSNFKELSSL